MEKQNNVRCRSSQTDKELEAKLKRALNNDDSVSFKRLVKGGVGVNAKFMFDSTLLHETVQLGKTDLVEILLKNKADVNHINCDGRTALHLACRSGHTDIVRLLIQYGADVNVSDEDKSSLQTAVWRGNEDIVHVLLENGVKVNSPDRNGWMPIHWATKQNYINIVKALIDAGSFIDNCVTNQIGRTPFIQALLNTNVRLARLLLAHGADVNMFYQNQSAIDMVINDKYLADDTKLDTVYCFLEFRFTCDQSKWKDILKKLEKLTNQTTSTKLEHIKQPIRALSGLSRNVIRSCSLKVTQGQSIYKCINSLPLPKILIEYVSFDSEIN